MHITIFGASGKVGRIVTQKALGQGHSVTAFVHHQAKFPHHPLLTIYRGDIHDPQSVSKAITGADAVICTLGSWGTPTKDILSEGMRTIIPAMQAKGLQRIVSLTGADARAHGDELGRIHKFTHFLLSIFARKVLRDSEAHIRYLQNSPLDWTVIRSPIMIEFSNPNRYTLASLRPMPWDFIHRRAVANSMLEEVRNPQHSRQAVFITRH